MEFNSRIPIYLQVIDNIKKGLSSVPMPPGGSGRELPDHSPISLVRSESQCISMKFPTKLPEHLSG